MQKRPDKVEAVCAGAFHTCFITQLGKLYGCGSNVYSQLSFTKANRLKQCFKSPTMLHLNPVRELRSGTELSNFGVQSLRNTTSDVKFTHVACNDRETMVATESGIVYWTGGSDELSVKNTSNVAAIAAGGNTKYIICHSSSSSSATSLMHVFSTAYETQQGSMSKKIARRSSSMLPSAR